MPGIDACYSRKEDSDFQLYLTFIIGNLIVESFILCAMSVGSWKLFSRSCFASDNFYSSFV